MWNKQRYCGQLQKHVRITNFSGETRKTSIPSESYFFMFLWHSWSCKEVCGTILWVDKQDDATTLQSIYSMHRWPPLSRRKNEICWRIVTSMISNCCEMQKTWHELEDLIFYGQRTKFHDRLRNGPKIVTNAWIDWFHIFIIRVNTNSIVMWVILPKNADWDCFKTLISRGDLEDSKSTSGGTYCIFGSHTIVPVSWMCKKQTSVSHSSTESEIISLDAGLRLDGIHALDLWDLIVLVFGKTTQNRIERRDV